MTALGCTVADRPIGLPLSGKGQARGHSKKEETPAFRPEPGRRGLQVGPGSTLIDFDGNTVSLDDITAPSDLRPAGQFAYGFRPLAEAIDRSSWYLTPGSAAKPYRMCCLRTVKSSDVGTWCEPCSSPRSSVPVTTTVLPSYLQQLPASGS